MGYDRWVDLVEKWDKSYDHQKARNLVDRLITAVGDRPSGILDKLFDHLEQQICDHLPKKVRRLESECERLKNNEYYVPQLRQLKTDAIREKVYAALADGPKTKTELARMFGLSSGAISSVGLRLRNAGQIKTICRGGRFMWARADTAPLFVPARDAIVAALKEGPMNVPGPAQKTGKGTSTVKSALHRHLLPNGRVIRATKRGTFALAGTQPPYISKCNAIVAALKEGSMNVPGLARVTCTTPSSLYQFIDILLAKGRVIRTRPGIYALPGSAPVYVPTCDAIISALTKRTMKLGSLVQHINKSTKSTRSRGAVTTVLRRLKKQGVVQQDCQRGEYRLPGSVRARPKK
jgi:DNA-binding transcriptional ArsR family regulator